jgi:hypothetical protein
MITHHFISMIQQIWKTLLIIVCISLSVAEAPVCFAALDNQSSTDARLQADNVTSGISNPDQPTINNPSPEIDNDYPCQKIRNSKAPSIKNKNQKIDNDKAGKIKNRSRSISNLTAGNVVNSNPVISNPETANVVNPNQNINNPEAGRAISNDQQIRNEDALPISNNTPGISNPEAPGIANSNGSISNPDKLFNSNGDHRIKNGNHFLLNFDWAFLGVYNWNIWYQPFFLIS